MTIGGTCEPRFSQVREEFERNFSERGELGAAVCVMLNGEPVVDLWGGLAQPRSLQAWQRDTMTVIWSSSKGAPALCANMLVDRGQLDLDAPVTRYWPEFAKHGKDVIPVRMLFNHQSGLTHFTVPVPEHGFNDWDSCIRLLEESTLSWEPGTRVGYHGITVGWLLGELVRRVTGRSVGTFFREEIAGPLDLEFWLGLPEELESKVAPTYAVTIADAAGALPPRHAAWINDENSVVHHALMNMGNYEEHFDSRESHAAEIPSSGAIANARGLAGMYAPLSLDGSINGKRLVSKEAIARMGRAQGVVEVDAFMGVRICFTLGFCKEWICREKPVNNSMIIGEDAFGCPGRGGQIGFADPSYRLAFGYTLNGHSPGTGLNVRSQSIIDAVYRILGSPGRDPDFWLRR